MPYVSKAQQGFFHTHVKAIGAKVVKEFDAASKGSHGLPEHVKHRKNGGPVVAKKHWMQTAVKPSHKGLFTEKANAAGKSVSEYAHEKEHAKGTLGKEARLALVFEHHH